MKVLLSLHFILFSIAIFAAPVYYRDSSGRISGSAINNCSNLVLPHHVCPKCGFYRGRQVITPEVNG